MIEEDKLNFFRKVIYERIDTEVKKSQMVFEQEKLQKLEEFNKYSKERKANEIAEAKEKFNFKTMELITKAKHESKQQILSFKETLIDKMISSLKNKFEEFAEGEGYKEFFMDLINKTVQFIEEQPAVIYITEKDFDRYRFEVDKLLKGRNITVASTDKPIIGGIIIEDKDKNFRIDNSILCVIEGNKDYISLMLLEALDREVSLFDE
jgi:vacuolar-type H+-ATPase subunit E/Vma4